MLLFLDLEEQKNVDVEVYRKKDTAKYEFKGVLNLTDPMLVKGLSNDNKVYVLLRPTDIDNKAIFSGLASSTK